VEDIVQTLAYLTHSSTIPLEVAKLQLGIAFKTNADVETFDIPTADISLGMDREQKSHLGADIGRDAIPKVRRCCGGVQGTRGYPVRTSTDTNQMGAGHMPIVWGRVRTPNVVGCILLRPFMTIHRPSDSVPSRAAPVDTVLGRAAPADTALRSLVSIHRVRYPR
jgi:hypothetical protein